MARLCWPPPLAKAEDLRVGDYHHVLPECESPEHGQRHERNRSRDRGSRQAPREVRVQAFGVQQFRQPQRLLRCDDHRLAALRPRPGLLRQRLQFARETRRGSQRQPSRPHLVGPKALQVNHAPPRGQRSQHHRGAIAQLRQSRRDRSPLLQFRPRTRLVFEQPRERRFAIFGVVQQDSRRRVQVVEGRRLVKQRLEEPVVVGATAAG